MTTEATGQIRRNGLWLQALIADQAGDTTAAMSALAEAVTTFDRPGPSLAGLPDVHDDVVFVRTALRAGHRQLATRAVEAAERRAWLNPTYPTAAAAARHARALLDADAACLREALAVMGDERPLVRASALEDLGRMLAPDRPREAVALLDDAAQRYDGCGAEHHAARVRTRLRRLGVRRRRTPEPEPSHGLAALTPGERAVVRLVAEGGTNRQVAQQLFLSPHTVNTHLRNAFGKLQVRSRVELTRVVASEEDA
jgi:DNA-binding CsgD family transcriptional regulator